MNLQGLSICSRYAYPPNSLSLCGPLGNNNLGEYSKHQKADKGAEEIIVKFTTLYPYLKLISLKNNIKDPFHPLVVEAYWLGNKLLNNVKKRAYFDFLTEDLLLKKKLSKKSLTRLDDKFYLNPLPSHSYHVLNIFKRTGYIDIDQTLATMDACLINWGKVKLVEKDKIIVESSPLTIENDRILFKGSVTRAIKLQGKKDKLIKGLKTGDMVSYHWGMFCEKLSISKLESLKYFTLLSINNANKEKN